MGRNTHRLCRGVAMLAAPAPTKPRDTVVVFARAPRLGAVKRRLAAEIGARAALRFHTETLARLLRMLSADRRFDTVLALTPDRARLRIPHRVTRMSQRGSDLGQRMGHAFRRFPRRRVAIIGCDIPDATAADVMAAFRAVRRADATFGPAADGGYWLVGMGPRRPARPFAAVRWSTRHALADTLTNFAHRRVALLRTLHDVDTAEDWWRWRTGRQSRATPARGSLSPDDAGSALATGIVVRQPPGRHAGAP